ncbi:hypothetical protein RJ640_015650 [Escallonia rubra]|uniref:PGG domain-containing protein n=1 Tax=Escallonia rubra TaxID=112253 RepID=A0AA88UC91_9ASTE|nr:hypothetical protein RJ640_015650 [Escallonia rubra]
MHLNLEGQTAEALFAESNAELRRDAKDWINRTAENCSIVAVFIATVAYAAAYTVPGGPNQTTGYPILLHKCFFLTFAITDVLSLAFALTSVIAFLSILTSPFRLEDFKHNLPRTLMIGFTLLIISVFMMMFAFAATIFLMIHNKQQWEKISLSSLAFLPATFFVFLYLRFNVSLMEPFKHSVKMLGLALPQCNSVRPHCSWITNLRMPAPLDLKKEQPKSVWDDEDVDENDVRESWEDEDEPAPEPVVQPPAEKVPKKSIPKSSDKKGKAVEVVKEAPLDPVAEKLRQQRTIPVIWYFVSGSLVCGLERSISILLASLPEQ